MKTLKIFILVICTVYAYNLTCPNYACNVTRVKENQKCAYEEKNKLTLSLCEEKLVCEKIELENPSVCVKVATPKGTLLPGELCTANEQCKSNNCEKDGTISVCKGFVKDVNCSSNSECDRGLFCDNGVCNTTGISCNEGGVGCSADEICDRANQKCVKFGSVTNGKDALVPALCRTYYKDAGGNCANGPKLKDIRNVICPNNGNCAYSVGGKDINTPCVCIKDDSTKKYCPPGIGDIDTDAVTLPLNI